MFVFTLYSFDISIFTQKISSFLKVLQTLQIGKIGLDNF